MTARPDRDQMKADLERALARCLGRPVHRVDFDRLTSSILSLFEIDTLM